MCQQPDIKQVDQDKQQQMMKETVKAVKKNPKTTVSDHQQSPQGMGISNTI